MMCLATRLRRCHRSFSHPLGRGVCSSGINIHILCLPLEFVVIGQVVVVVASVFVVKTIGAPLDGQVMAPQSR